jgi:hypothetical protein
MLELRFQGSVENNGSTSGTIRGVSSLKYTTACVHNIHFFNSSSENCLLAQSFQKCLPLLLWQKLEEPRHRKQQHLWIPVVQVGPRQEGRADHFQTVAAGSVATQHQTRSFDRPLNDRQLALVQFEPSSRTGLLPSSPLRTVHESFLSHSSSPSNASFGETRFQDRKVLAVNPVVALRMKEHAVFCAS